MSITGLLKQTIYIYSQSSYTADGRISYGSSTTIQARVEKVNKQVVIGVGAQQQQVLVELVVYVPSGTDIEVDDKVTYSSVDYKVWQKKHAVDGQGNDHHIEVELIKWQP